MMATKGINHSQKRRSFVTSSKRVTNTLTVEISWYKMRNILCTSLTALEIHSGRHLYFPKWHFQVQNITYHLSLILLKELSLIFGLNVMLWPEIIAKVRLTIPFCMLQLTVLSVSTIKIYETATCYVTCECRMSAILFQKLDNLEVNLLPPPRRY